MLQSDPGRYSSAMIHPTGTGSLRKQNRVPRAAPDGQGNYERQCHRAQPRKHFAAGSLWRFSANCHQLLFLELHNSGFSKLLCNIGVEGTLHLLRHSVKSHWSRACIPWLRMLLSPSILRPNALDRAVVQLPKSLDFLYYAIRPLRILLDRSGR